MDKKYSGVAINTTHLANGKVLEIAPRVPMLSIHAGTCCCAEQRLVEAASQCWRTRMMMEDLASFVL